MEKRNEGEIIRDILGCYMELSPENLSCDGERSRQDTEDTEQKIRANLENLFKELGRHVSEEQAYGMVPWGLP